MSKTSSQIEDLSEVNTAPRPFLKWVGGKTQLLSELHARIAMVAPLHRYHEPFMGGGALYFSLYAAKALGTKAVQLSDQNQNLLDAYIGVRDHLDELIRLLQQHKARHSEEHYYEVRATNPRSAAGRAARIIYLNKTCYNGLYRENSKGQFNVPMGRYKNPLICDEPNLRAVSQALQSAQIGQRDFREVLKHAKKGDFVYFDPPYWPVSASASFTAYAKDNFGQKDQEELAAVYAALSKRGVHALLSNSDTPFINELYKEFQIDIVQANRNVNSKGDRRGKVNEVLVRNFGPDAKKSK